MCGISGIYYNKKISKKEIEKPVAAMMASQARRGPDDEGSFFHSSKNISLVLGHNRLSILDLTKAGHQPMEWASQKSKVESQKLAITFNGEIYNFKELRRDLEKQGYEFKTNSDTEVILALFDRYGTESFAKLRGMFAFGLWDEKSGKLYLVRDHFGIKPLYYYRDGEKIVFASTVGAIKNSGLIKPEKNENASALFLLFGSIPEPFTTDKNIKMLPAGHYMEVGSENIHKPVKYYDLLEHFMNKKETPFIQAAKRTREIIQNSVSAHMISDAPLGVFLSGGVDSSTIALLAARTRKEPITTLSIDFEEKEFSEKKYQDLIQRQIGSNHKRTVVTKANFDDLFKNVLEAMDQPTIDGVNTFFVSKAAYDAGLKVVLSGLGSDEIFFGYSGFRRFSKIRMMARMPKIIRFCLSLASLLGKRCGKMSYLKRSDLLRSYLVLRGLFIPAEVSKILNKPEKEINEIIDNYIQESNLFDSRLELLDSADVYSYLELNIYMRSQLLKDTDFMSMYHSLEVRVPFVDIELINYVVSLPAEIKFSGGRNKGLLIEAMSDVLPREIYNRRKMGFAFPFRRWMQQEVNGQELRAKSHLPFANTSWSRFWTYEIFSRFLA